MPDHAVASALVSLASTMALPEDGRAVAAAALSGPEWLKDAIAEVPGATMAAGPTEDEPAAAPGTMYLTSVSVCGFRGIAARTDLELQPVPGLVLVTGRNGSGKTSIAEAAEVALSGSSLRSSSKLWSDGLKNLHYDGQAEVGVGLRIDGVGDVTVTCTLAGDHLRQASTVTYRGVDQYDLAVHGWNDVVSRFRPVLTYAELSALASSKPSELYDPINNIVGLDGLTAADKLLARALTEQKRIVQDATEHQAALLEALAGSRDPRAAALQAALQVDSSNVKLARVVLAGATKATATSRETLTIWANLAAPKPAEARTVVDALTDALGHSGRAAAGATGRAKQLADLLELAISHREHPGDLCPVCGQGQLDDGWLDAARRQAQEAREHAEEARLAADALSRARADARQLLSSAPIALAEPAVAGIDPSPAADAWAALVRLGDGPTDEDRDRAFAVGLVDAVDRLAVEIANLNEMACRALAAQHEAWEPISRRAEETLRLLEAAEAARLRIRALGDARRWLREFTEMVRRQRVSRFADEATAIWKGLRQDSNVGLEGVTLVGTNTRREVHLDLTVDGTPGPQAVLSQGELTALGLSLFLPRSTSEDSPFRFVLIDDPVQSMDPSKVDGLARVLHGLAEKRQVIVFTHDDRLPQALRRLGLPATVYVIDRGERSAITVRHVTDAVDQYLRDADALVKEVDLPSDLIAVAVSGYCRDAVNEIATEVARRRLPADGMSVGDAEAAVASAGGTRALLALALLGDARKTGTPLDKVLVGLGPTASDVVTACIEGVHAPDPIRMRSLLEDTRGLINALRAAA